MKWNDLQFFQQTLTWSIYLKCNHFPSHLLTHDVLTVVAKFVFWWKLWPFQTKTCQKTEEELQEGWLFSSWNFLCNPKISNSNSSWCHLEWGCRKLEKKKTHFVIVLLHFWCLAVGHLWTSLFDSLPKNHQEPDASSQLPTRHFLERCRGERVKWVNEDVDSSESRIQSVLGAVRPSTVTQ